MDSLLNQMSFRLGTTFDLYDDQDNGGGGAVPPTKEPVLAWDLIQSKFINMTPPSSPTARLGQDWILAEGRHEPIQPGMRVEAKIKTGNRRAIEYLLSPVMQAVQEAGRER